MNWENVIKNKSDEEFTPTREEALQSVGGDELALIVFGELGKIVSALSYEIRPQSDQRYNPSKKIMDNIKALQKVYDRLQKIGDKRYKGD